MARGRERSVRPSSPREERGFTRRRAGGRSRGSARAARWRSEASRGTVRGGGAGGPPEQPAGGARLHAAQCGGAEPGVRPNSPREEGGFTRRRVGGRSARAARGRSEASRGAVRGDGAGGLYAVVLKWVQDTAIHHSVTG